MWRSYIAPDWIRSSAGVNVAMTVYQTPCGGPHVDSPEGCWDCRAGMTASGCVHLNFPHFAVLQTQTLIKFICVVWLQNFRLESKKMKGFHFWLLINFTVHNDAQLCSSKNFSGLNRTYILYLRLNHTQIERFFNGIMSSSFYWRLSNYSKWSSLLMCTTLFRFLGKTKFEIFVWFLLVLNSYAQFWVILSHRIQHKVVSRFIIVKCGKAQQVWELLQGTRASSVRLAIK